MRFVVKKMAALRTSARHDERVYGLWFIVAYAYLKTATVTDRSHSAGMLCVLSKQCKNKTSENLCACSVYLCVTKQLSRKLETLNFKHENLLHTPLQYFAPKPAVTLQKNFSTEEDLSFKY